jgi:ketosteroid isomerase-like protein
VPEPRDLETLRAAYREWARGDFSRDDFIDPEFESRSFGVGPDWIGEIKGREHVAAEMANWLAAWERPLVIEAEEFSQSGDRILVLVRWKGRGRGSGIEMEAEGAHLWTFRDGLAIRFDVYRDREEARAALEAG